MRKSFERDIISMLLIRGAGDEIDGVCVYMYMYTCVCVYEFAGEFDVIGREFLSDTFTRFTALVYTARTRVTDCLPLRQTDLSMRGSK